MQKCTRARRNGIDNKELVFESNQRIIMDLYHPTLV